MRARVAPTKNRTWHRRFGGARRKPMRGSTERERERERENARACVCVCVCACVLEGPSRIELLSPGTEPGRHPMGPEPPTRIELAARDLQSPGATMRGGERAVPPGRCDSRVVLPAPTCQIGGVTTRGGCQSRRQQDSNRCEHLTLNEAASTGLASCRRVCPHQEQNLAPARRRRRTQNHAWGQRCGNGGADRIRTCVGETPSAITAHQAGASDLTRPRRLGGAGGIEPPPSLQCH